MKPHWDPTSKVVLSYVNKELFSAPTDSAFQLLCQTLPLGKQKPTKRPTDPRQRVESRGPLPFPQLLFTKLRSFCLLRPGRRFWQPLPLLIIIILLRLRLPNNDNLLWVLSEGTSDKNTCYRSPSCWVVPGPPKACCWRFSAIETQLKLCIQCFRISVHGKKYQLMSFDKMVTTFIILWLK